MSNSNVEVREFPEHGLLGRRFAVLDPQSRTYAAVGALVGESQAPRNKTWRRYPRVYDQGRTSECVAYSGKGMVNTAPFRRKVDSRTRLDLETTKVYKLAQTLDPWPGEDYDGTSVLAGAKALKQMGLIRAYRWCFGINDVLRTVSWYGPVTIGVAWHNSMFRPDNRGFIKVDERSGMVGGHAVQIQGINADDEYVVITNSWGEDWGDRGRCYMSWTDLDKLLADWGEAVTYE